MVRMQLLRVMPALIAGGEGNVEMRVTRIHLAAVGCALAALAGVHSAMAQPMGPPGMPGGTAAAPDPLVTAASRWDANHDGVFTCDEWKQHVSRIFSIPDKNADGFLDAKEFQQLGKFEPVFSSADIGYFDENHDQRVSRKEFIDKPNPFFARYDANGDCRVTRDELKGPAAVNRPKGGPPGGGPPGRMDR